MEGETFQGGGTRPPDENRSYANATRGGMNDNVRAYAAFVQSQKKERNLIELKFKKDQSLTSDQSVNRYLDLETVGDFIFNTLKVEPEELLDVDLNTGR